MAQELIKSGKNLDRLLLVWWLVALLSALRIYGPYHADEWYQVTAFMLNRLGLHPDAEMPWELEAQIRPWLQPAMYTALFGPFIKAWGYNPIIVERLMLLVQWLILGGALIAFARIVGPITPADRRRYRWGALALAALWFAPSMLVRHSSEAFSSALLVMSLGAWMRVERDAEKRAPALLSGLLAGLAFWGRYQVAFFIAAFWVTRLVARNQRRRLSLALFAGGLVVALGIGFAVDCWGYQEVVFTPWRYFTVNVLESRASDYGVNTAWYYLLIPMAFTANPAIWLWFYRGARSAWSNPFVRSLAVGVLAFLAVHSVIPHKEPRFIVPMLAPAAIVMLYGLAAEVPGRWRFAFAPALSKVLVGLNVIALIGLTSFGLVRQRRGIDWVLWEAPRPEAAITAVNVFGTFDERVGDFPPNDRPFGSSFVHPAEMRLIGAYPEDFAEACARSPEAVVIVSDHDRHADGTESSLIDEPLRAIARSPAHGLDLPFPRKRWRYAVVACDRFDP